MVNVNVDYAELERSANQLAAAKDDIDGQLRTLKGMIDSLVGGGFRTDLASVKFQQSYEQWNSGATNVMGGLEGMTSFLRTAIERHRALDSELGQQTGA